jgi:hypothetical protein
LWAEIYDPHMYLAAVLQIAHVNDRRER